MSDCNCKILLTQFEMCNFPYLKKKKRKVSCQSGHFIMQNHSDSQELESVLATQTSVTTVNRVASLIITSYHSPAENMKSFIL